MKSYIAAAVLLASAVSAAPAPLQKRADQDSKILNYALTLEHLEAAFYTEGLKNFTKADFAKAGFNDVDFYRHVEELSVDEHSHVEVLTAVLKAAKYNATAACTYDFPVTSAADFVALASVLEGVGVNAYLGAAASITNKEYLTAAGSILTVEARHNAFIRNSRGQAPFPAPYDIPLDFDQVYSLAAPFIKSCPKTNPSLGVKAFPAMTYSGATKYPRQGSSITFALPKSLTIPSGSLYVAWPLVTGPVFQNATVNKADHTVTCKIPESMVGPAGQSYAILTSGKDTLTDANTIAGPAVVPVLAPEYYNF